MNYKEFVGQVQHRLELPGMGQAVRATRAVLTTLGERLQEGEATDLAGPLPMEIDRYLIEADSGQRFDLDEFVGRVAERAALADDEGGRSTAFFYGQAIVALLAEVVPGSEMRQVRDQLPADYDDLFELVDVEGAFD